MKHAVISLLLIFAFSAWAQEAPSAKTESKAKAATAKSAKSTGADSQALIDKEKSLWEAWKNKDMKPFQSQMADDALNLDSSSGMWVGKQEMIKGMTDHPCEVTSYSLSDEKVTNIDKDAALVTYTATQDATCDGKKIPEKIYASSVWAKRGGKWVGLSHQETPAAPASTTAEKKQ